MAVYTIRKPTLADVDGIAHVQVQSWIETYTGIMPDAFIARLPETFAQRQEMWQNAIPREDIIIAVAEESAEGEIVGFVSGGALIEGDFEVDGQLYAIYLLKSAQGHGIGRKLVETFMRGMMAADKRSVAVWVLKDNPTREFYKHLGAEYLTVSTIQIGGADLIEEAYIWQSLDDFQFSEGE